MQLVEMTAFDYDYLIQLENTESNELNNSEIDYLLSWINYRIREFLLKDSIDFKGLCGYAADLLSVLLSALNIRFYQVNINSVLKWEQPKHVITIVNFSSFDDGMYILDPTYKQFVASSIFNKAIDTVEKGRFFVENLIINGYFKLTLENIKIYFDIFNQFSILMRGNDCYQKYSGEEYKKRLFKCSIHENYPVNPIIALTPSQLKSRL